MQAEMTILFLMDYPRMVWHHGPGWIPHSGQYWVLPLFA